MTKTSLTGDKELDDKLKQMSAIDFDAIATKSLTQIYNRGKNDGGTPVKTGQLRLSLMMGADEVGYTKDYAPHVEYGHRTRGGGFVEGQLFLKKNVDAQAKIFAQDIKKAIV